jgi:hypothetical protein
VVGYVNAYTDTSQRPNAQLVLNADRPLGQHSWLLRLEELGADREILIAYGPRQVFKDKMRSGPNQNNATRSVTIAVASRGG